MSPAAQPDCLTALVGLSQGTTACYPLPTDDAQAAAITASATGVYMDAVEGIRLGPAANAQAATDLYAQLAKARTTAVQQVRTAILMARQNSFGVSLYTQRGTLGGQGNGQLASVGTRALLTFWTNYAREGAWRITKLSAYTSIPLVDAPLLLDNTQVALLTTDVNGNATGLPAGGLVIPLDGSQHTLEVVLPDAVRVKQNKVYCFGCNAGSPWALAVNRAIRGWDSNTLGNGLSFYAAEECTADPDFLCFAAGKDDGQADFRYPDIAHALALAIAYKAAAIFLSNLLATNQVGRYTMLEKEQMPKLADFLESKLTTPGPGGTGNWLTWLNSPNGLGQVRHPCFMGPPMRQPGKVWTG